MKSKLGIIIGREFFERTKKKSFIIVTIITPLLMIGLMFAPLLIALLSTPETKEVHVIDNSGIVLKNLKSDQEVVFIPCDMPLDSACAHFTSSYGVLYVGSDIVKNPSNLKLYANDAASISVESSITSQVKKIIEDEKLKTYHIDNINKILDEVETDVTLQTFKYDVEGNDEEANTSSTLSYAIGMILGLFLYMFLLIYGQMVMTSVIEEKGNRVLEVMVSSVSPFQLMLGKIIGVACVAIVQIFIWGVLLTSVSALIPMFLPSDIAQSIAMANAGTMSASSPIDSSLVQALALVSNIGFIIQLFVYLILFLIGGFLLYAAMFAAIGSAVDNIQDASQLQLPVTLPIILSLVLLMTIMADPNSQLAIWCSMIPFTSPVVMLGRIPFGIPTWEVIISLVILYASFIGMVWVAAKIYRVGIFMYGKKPSFKELIKWIRYK